MTAFTSEQILGFSKAAADAIARDSVSLSVSPADLMALSDLAAAGMAGVDGLRDHVKTLKPKAGDLLVFYAKADGPAEFLALKSSLSAVSKEFGVRVMAVEPSSRLEQVSGVLLEHFGNVVQERLNAVRYDPATDAPRRARIVAEAAGELGLIIQRPTQ